MGAGRLRRPAGPHLLAQGARILRAGTPVARRQARRSSGGVKIFLYYIGRAKDSHFNALAEDYMTRAARYAHAQMAEIRPDRVDLWAKHPTARKIFLDP